MPVTNISKDADNLTMTIEAAFAAPIDRVWEMWSDPRLLERWWGPPTHPATVVEHDLKVGGSVKYFMTGPEGDRHRGWWRVLAVDPPRKLEFEDGFADEDGNPNEDMPTMVSRVALAEDGDAATSVTIETKFGSLEAMQQLIEMGMEEGSKLAINQIDALL
jgi:uncharacterized protein YndB with AHSA1/START domain